MVQPAANMIAKRVSWYEAIAILFIIALTWIDEILDIPYVLLGGPSTPINWRESLFESLVIGLVGWVIIRHTYRLLVRVSYLESILPICASCKKIRLDPAFWTDVKALVEERAKAGFTHGICPECIEKYYPELSGDKRAAAPGEE